MFDEEADDRLEGHVVTVFEGDLEGGALVEFAEERVNDNVRVVLLKMAGMS